MRIVYYTPPSTPGQYFGLAIKACLLAYFGTGLLYFLFNLISSFDNKVLEFFHNIFHPVTSPIFYWAGLEPSISESGIYTVFLLLFLPGLLNVFPMMRLKLEQLRLLDEAYGPVKRPEHIWWFSGSVLFLIALCLLRYMQLHSDNTIIQLYINCTRAGAVVVLGLSSLCFLIIGMRLRGSWQKSPNAVKMPAAKKPRGNLKVAVDNTAPAKKTVPNAAPAPVRLIESDTGIYVALTAEIIQAAGRTKALPTPDALMGPMEMMQKAALMTRSGQFSHSDLKGLCERTCALLAEGKLKHMPDLKTALALYKRANPAKLTEIAAELKQQLEN